MYHYSETLEFDLVVILFVVVVMPLAVMLMQSRDKMARAASFGLLFLAVLYVVRLMWERRVDGQDGPSRKLPKLP